MLGNHSSLLDEFPRFLPVVRLMHRPTMQRHAVRSFSGKRQKSLATTLPVVVILSFIVVFIKLVNNGLLWVIMGYYGIATMGHYSNKRILLGSQQWVIFWVSVLFLVVNHLDYDGCLLPLLS